MFMHEIVALSGASCTNQRTFRVGRDFTGHYFISSIHRSEPEAQRVNDLWKVWSSCSMVSNSKSCSDGSSAVRAVSITLSTRPLIQGIIQHPTRAIPPNTIIREVRTEVIIPFHLPNHNQDGERIIYP